jgi:hypothetical protein
MMTFQRSVFRNASSAQRMDPWISCVFHRRKQDPNGRDEIADIWRAGPFLPPISAHFLHTSPSLHAWMPSLFFPASQIIPRKHPKSMQSAGAKDRFSARKRLLCMHSRRCAAYRTVMYFASKSNSFYAHDVDRPPPPDLFRYFYQSHAELRALHSLLEILSIHTLRPLTA